jgi:hypothetical protein
MIDWTDRLSEYLDDELSGAERAELEATLQGNAELRQVLEELRAVRDRAATLPRSEPRLDLWPGIEARIREHEASVVPIAAGRERRRFSFTVPQLAAAAAAFLVLGSGTAWVAAGLWSTASEPGASLADVRPAAGPQSTDASLAAASDAANNGPSSFSYEQTIRDLEERVKIGRGQLSPETVEALETSLATIDRAIARAREALEADPANVYLNRHLADARTRKLQILQQAALLASS